jgi:hypothetical protein
MTLARPMFPPRATAPEGARLSPPSSISGSPADPAFDAIDAHRRAVAAYNATCVQQEQLEADIPREKRQTGYCPGEDLEVAEADDPRWIAFETDMKSCTEAEIDAECELADVVPTTLAGVIALLDYATTVEKGTGFREIYFDPDEPEQKLGRSWYYFVTRNLADSLRAIAA